MARCAVFHDRDTEHQRFDVEAPFEIDTIYVYDDRVRTLIGNLSSSNNTIPNARSTITLMPQ